MPTRAELQCSNASCEKPWIRTVDGERFCLFHPEADPPTAAQLEAAKQRAYRKKQRERGKELVPALLTDDELDQYGDLIPVAVDEQSYFERTEPVEPGPGVREMQQLLASAKHVTFAPTPGTIRVQGTEATATRAVAHLPEMVAGTTRGLAVLGAAQLLEVATDLTNPYEIRWTAAEAHRSLLHLIDALDGLPRQVHRTPYVFSEDGLARHRSSRRQPQGTSA